MISLRSKITQNVLSYLFPHPGQTFYLNELARQLKVDSGNLTRKLNELTTEGILQSEVRGNLKYFGLNSKFPLLDEYRRIVQKTVGVEVMLKEALEKVDGVKQAYLYGSYAANRMDSSLPGHREPRKHRASKGDRAGPKAHRAGDQLHGDDRDRILATPRPRPSAEINILETDPPNPMI